jgi:hypothetical protein
MRRHWFVALALLCLFAPSAGAQDTTERQVKAAPRRDNRVAVYTNILPDCTSGPLPAIRLVVPPVHGAVSVKRGTLKVTNFKQCLAIEAPVLVALYRPADDFRGIDEFELEIALPGGRKQYQHFRVNVASGAGGGQGI